MPKSPNSSIDLNKFDHGALFKGDKGFVVTGFDTRILMPYGKGDDLSYYNRRPKEKMLPPIGNFQKEWTNACKGGLKTSCDFDYAGKMIEMMLLGLVAYRVGKKIEYNGQAGQTNDAQANALLSQKYRDGWVLDG